MTNHARTSCALGIDVGGSGIKGAVVDLSTGEFVGGQITIETPQPATPEAVADTIAEIARRAQWTGPVGVALPSVIKGQVALTAANVDPAWVGTNAHEVLARRLDTSEISVLNDADAAGLAEVAFGGAQIRDGAVIFLTFGTGIGSAFFIDGRLFPNTELGHMTVGCAEAEHQASSAVKDREQLSFEQWAGRVDTVVREFDRLFNPALFVVGGGISEDADSWVPLLTVETPVVAAKLRNRAGIVGAAMAAAEHLNP
ncbi:ROK family protein [Corynebacterium qintianiae]|uniref:ROK family protein n=1 Tax=Corynebacterium qintianiae TaxID=2709392 RepID=A0A7T0KKJ1_9CORY|nr:ROK family protein [Corynebacterium qintianiae]QPK82491.1 ROK family protein [Corynebacterium qintianiae]